MSIQPIEPGRNLHDLAAIAGVDWRDIASRNDIDPLAPVPISRGTTALDIPSPSEARPAAPRALSNVTNTVRTVTGRVGGLVSEVESIANQVAGVLPESLRGYVAPALDAIAEVNAIVGNVSRTLDGAIQSVERQYGGAAVRLIDWMFLR